MFIYVTLLWVPMTKPWSIVEQILISCLCKIMTYKDLMTTRCNTLTECFDFAGFSCIELFVNICVKFWTGLHVLSDYIVHKSKHRITVYILEILLYNTSVIQFSIYTIYAFIGMCATYYLQISPTSDFVKLGIESWYCLFLPIVLAPE